MRNQVELRDGTNPRGRGKRWLRSSWTNDAEDRAPGDRRTTVSAKSFEGQGRLGGGSGAGDSRRSARNQANPMTGSRAQQTCKPCAEQTAEVGKNDKGGTRSGVANPNLGKPSVDAHGEVGGGAIFEELHERSPRELVISVTGRRGRQANRRVFERETTGCGERGTAGAVSVSRAGPGQPGRGKANDPQLEAPCEVKTEQHQSRNQPWKATSEPGALCSIL